MPNVLNFQVEQVTHLPYSRWRCWPSFWPEARVKGNMHFTVTSCPLQTKVCVRVNGIVLTLLQSHSLLILSSWLPSTLFIVYYLVSRFWSCIHV